MMLKSTIPPGPLYDPKSKVRKFRFEEDINNIRLNVLGKGAVYKDPKFLYYLDKDKEWRRPKEICNRPVFINGKPERFDALQGEEGDCWLVGGIEEITLNNKLIEHVVPPDQSFGQNYIGAFHFRIWQLGTWYDVVVDDRLPVYKKDKTLCYVHSMSGDVFWAALLEKAYAKVCGTSTVSYGSLTGGYSITSMQDFSGGIVERVETSNPPAGKTLKFWMNEIFLKNALMCCVCYKNIQKDDLVAYHTYAITKIFMCPDDDPDYHGLFLVRIMNPWGNIEWKGDWSDDNFDLWKQIDRDIRKKLNFVIRNDGEFWMNEIDFAKYFELIWICHLGPGQYLESHDNIKDFTTWRTTAFYGEWIKGFSAGGEEISTRHKNPQYRIIMEWPENDSNIDGMCNVVIELVQRSKYGRRIRPFIAAYIYSLDHARNPPMPLDKRFFENNDPLNKNPEFKFRAFVLSMKLEPGKYCIVPCSELQNEESQFLLRIFSESRVELWEHDTQISKSLPTEEQCMNEFNEPLHSLFNEIAQGQGEIDWIGLKKILEVTMNPKRSWFGMITSFFKFMRGVFEEYTLLGPSIDCKTSDVVFSKHECRSMIAMLDDNQSGKLSFSEFSNLWNKINFWTKVFEQHRDKSEGYVTVAQLRDALSSIGYNINKRTVHSLSYFYVNEQGIIFLIDFILCGVTLEVVLALYEKKHVEDGNKMSFTLEEWVKNTLNL